MTDKDEAAIKAAIREMNGSMLRQIVKEAIKELVAENVKGLLLGEAKAYVRRIYKEFDVAGYYVQHFLLDASKMGIPQRRERVFFVAFRKDLALNFLHTVDMFTTLPKLKLEFNEKPIPFKDVFHDYEDRPLTEHMKKIWDLRIEGDGDFEHINKREFNKPNLNFNTKFIYMNSSNINTITASDQCVLFDYPRYRNFDELCECGTYPKDYNFVKNKPEYLIGMSVPPIMTARIADEIYNQWLNKLK